MFRVDSIEFAGLRLLRGAARAAGAFRDCGFDAAERSGTVAAAALRRGGASIAVGLPVRSRLFVILFFFTQSDWQTQKRRLLRRKSRGTRHDSLRKRLLPAATRPSHPHGSRNRGKRLLRRRRNPRGYQDGDDAGRVLGAVHNRGDGAELAGRFEDRDDDRSVCGGTNQLGVRRHTRGRGQDRYDRIAGRDPRDYRGDPQVPVQKRGSGPRYGGHQVGDSRGNDR